MNRSFGFSLGSTIQRRSFFGIEPDLGSHQAQQKLRARAEPRHPDGRYTDGPSLETGDAVNVFGAEQNEAADMHAGQERCRLALVEPDNEVRGIAHHQIHVAARQQLGGISGRRRLGDKADVAKALRLQQLPGDHLRHGADCRIYRKFDGRRLRVRLGCSRSERRQHPRDASERCGPEKAASGLQCGSTRLARGAKPAEACRAGERGIGQEPAASLDRHGTPP
jgi:hypothetical protein